MHQYVSRLLDNTCVLISHLTGAHSVFLTQQDPGKKAARLVCKAGLPQEGLSLTFSHKGLDETAAQMMLIANIKTDPRTRDNPELKLAPHIKSLMAFLVPGTKRPRQAVIAIVNPSKAALGDGNIIRGVLELCVIISNTLELKSHLLDTEDQNIGSARDDRPLMEKNTTGSRDVSGFASTEADTKAATRFVCETLLEKRSLHSRGGVDFSSLRTWRAPIKQYQISAIAALKDDPPPHFIKLIAQDFVAHTKRTHGADVIKSVVPIPPGSSGRQQSVSTMVAEEVALQIGAAYCNCLLGDGKVSRGPSSPKKSALLSPYKLSRVPNGPILLVDDIVTSGRHFELAVNVLKLQSVAVYPVAWIGR